MRRSWSGVLFAALLCLVAVPALSQEEAPDVAGDVPADEQPETVDPESTDVTEIPEEQPAEESNDGFVDPRNRHSVFDEPASSDRDARERPDRDRPSDELPPPTERESRFDEPVTAEPAHSDPYVEPAYDDSSTAVRSHPRVWPITFGFKVGALGTDEYDDDLVSYTAWLGYRHRPFDEEFGPFTSIGLEGTIMDDPFSVNTIGVVAPTIRAGVDWAPDDSPLPMMSLYAIGGYIIGPSTSFEYGTRFGVGFSVLPLIVFEMPSAIEVTTETYVSEQKTLRMWHLQLGWMF